MKIYSKVGGFYIALFLCWLSVGLIYADVGPKPSLHIEVKGVEEEAYYVTAFSSKDSNGPLQATESKQQYASSEYLETQEGKAWLRFHEYSLIDDFYFLPHMEKCDSSDNLFSWTYRPPKVFKIAIYLPKQDKLIVSGVYERFFFHSKFTAQLYGDRLIVFTPGMQFIIEIFWFLLRVVLTIGVELLLAYYVFHYRQKWQIQSIIRVNLYTQVLLNLVLGMALLLSGLIDYFIAFGVMEVIVILIEATAYYFAFRKYNASQKEFLMVFLYTVLANILSLVVGIVIHIS
ncbi:hypothetical protein EII17_00075 [Clostridiales bacterium COT073_COT-073]|nr:hypothetical protein EII17_00075 [Clostridiales bacterium COT073_COT-073]